MDPTVIHQNKDRLLKSIPLVREYLEKFRAINSRWSGAITSGMIETGHMPSEASQIFTPLIEDMRSTKSKYGEIQEKLIDAILIEMAKKIVLELSDTAKFAINILKRNLFERTADVGYLATDAEIVTFLKTLRDSEPSEIPQSLFEAIRGRLVDYQYEYSVYNEIIILDRDGRVQANLDTKNSISRSRDPLLQATQAINLHRQLDEDKYVETYRHTDLRPHCASSLIYSQKIEDPDQQTALGTLCLSFDFEDEMSGIFADLSQGNSNIIVAILSEDGRVMISNYRAALPVGCRIAVDLKADFRFLTFNGKTYLAKMVETDGYQGFYGLTWYAIAMIDIEFAFKSESGGNDSDHSTVGQLQNFSKELAAIKRSSEELLDDMKVDSINGRVKATKFQAKAFVEVLQYVKWVGEEIDDIFNAAISNLQQTIVTSLFNDVQFRAFQGNNIADRNLYERANDVCWWALTPLFRKLMARHLQQGLGEDECRALTSNLQYINDLYTPYLRLVLADPGGKIIAVSNPPAELEERFEEEGLPSGQEFVDMQLDKELVRKALRLSSHREYCVSEFQPTPLYGGRPTSVYSTAIRDPQNDRKPVGVIQIVFDAEPQFLAMLSDILPRDEQQDILAGSFGVFADRRKLVLSSTSASYPPGSFLNLPDQLFKGKNGERQSTIVEIDGQTYALGFQVSEGYREYKRNDGYSNDILCMIFVPI